MQDKYGASNSTRKQEDAQELIGVYQKNKGVSLKDLPLAKFGIILAPKRIMNVTDYATMNNPSL